MRIASESQKIEKERERERGNNRKGQTENGTTLIVIINLCSKDVIYIILKENTSPLIRFTDHFVLKRLYCNYNVREKLCTQSVQVVAEREREIH